MTVFSKLARLLLTGLLLTATLAQAQFSGPPLLPNPAQNVPLLPTTDPSLLMPGQRDQLIVTGDLLSVRLYRETDYTTIVRVSVDGNIQLPLIGTVSVGGLTVYRAEDVIAKRLITAGMYNNPQVIVTVTEAAVQFATVAGEMHAIVPLAGDRRLLDVLAAAGTLPPTASRVITILRPGLDKPIIIDLGSNPAQMANADIQIFAGDKILVSRVGAVYVLGAFRNQGVIPLQQNSPLTLMQATALSGGTGFEGRFNDLRIVRSVGLTRTVVKVDIAKIVQGKAPDPVLQADDIVFLPSNQLKAIIKNGGLGTLFSVISFVLLLAQANY